MVSIRPITPNDTDKIIAWRNNPRVRRNFIDQNLLTKEIHTRWLETVVNTGKAEQFIIEADGTGVGSVFLRDIDNAHKKAEFGIFIGEDGYAGKGVGTEAARKILEYAFDSIGLNKVFLRVLADNAAAIRSYEKCGFVREGCFREDVIAGGQFRDVVFMSMLKSDFKKN